MCSVLHLNQVNLISIILLAAMNGSRSDKALFNESTLKENIEKGRWLAGPYCLIHNTPIPELMLADAGFASNKSYMVTPYTL